MGRVGSRLRVTLATVLQTHKKCVTLACINELSTLNHIPPTESYKNVGGEEAESERGGKGRELKVGGGKGGRGRAESGMGEGGGGAESGRGGGEGAKSGREFGSERRGRLSWKQEGGLQVRL